MTKPFQKVDYDLTNGTCRIANADIPNPGGFYVLIQPDLGFTRNDKGDPMVGPLIVTEGDCQSEIYQCCTGNIVAMGDMAYYHRESEDLRGKPWLGTWPKLGDRVLFRDGGAGQHVVINGVDLFIIVDEDVRLILTENAKVKGFMANSGIHRQKPVGSAVSMQVSNGANSVNIQSIDGANNIGIMQTSGGK